jgi:NAD-dependent dihydropyrimidine dehydrogenase PreA subunit
MALPIIDRSLCTACGRCVEVCPAKCIELKSSAELSKPEKCISCGRCIRACPVKAIAFARQEAVKEK